MFQSGEETLRPQRRAPDDGAHRASPVSGAVYHARRSRPASALPQKPNELKSNFLHLSKISEK
jgi:hypothetical protein